MRILLLLAAGSAAVGTAAPARPAADFAGRGGGAPGVAASAGGPRVRSGWQVYVRPGLGRPGHHRGRFGRPGRDGIDFDGGYGLAGPGGIVAPWGDGFFAPGGGEVRMKAGRPVYDYDRSYPYEWPSAAGGRGRRWEVGFVSEPPPHCTIEHGVRVCRGW
ncbi:MAG TPA: hypothetical protein VF547_08955 [Allosphingosinicella sp.]